MIDHLDDLLDVGLSSLKIEGRAKSAYYAAIVTGAYRHCLDDAAAGRPIGPGVAGRGGARQPPATTPPAFTTVSPASITKIPATSGNGRWWRWSRNVTPTATPSFPCGTSSAPVTRVELVGPDLRPFSMTVPEMRDEAGTVIEEPRNPQMLLKLRLPRSVPPMTLVRHQVELSAKVTR